jgi:thiol:disulfide interchange protein
MGRTDQRSIPVALIAIAAVLLLARIGCAQRETKETGAANALVKWHTPAEGLQLAQSSGKPVMFDFTAEWCGPCHMLDAQVFRNADVAKTINERFIAIRVTDRQREDGRNPPDVAQLSERYSINGFPTVVFADANGTERARMEGFGGRTEFVRIMERAR